VDLPASTPQTQSGSGSGRFYRVRWQTHGVKTAPRAVQNPASRQSKLLLGGTGYLTLWVCFCVALSRIGRSVCTGNCDCSYRENHCG